jgi:hypothetical protein
MFSFHTIINHLFTRKKYIYIIYNIEIDSSDVARWYFNIRDCGIAILVLYYTIIIITAPPPCLFGSRSLQSAHSVSHSSAK